MSPFWTAFWILFIYIPLVTIWFFGLTDVFRRADLSGIAKAVWVLVIMFLPIIGLLIYFSAHPAREDGLAYYDYGADSGPTVAEELELLADLHDRGKLTDEEFAQEKHRALVAP